MIRSVPRWLAVALAWLVSTVVITVAVPATARAQGPVLTVELTALKLNGDNPTDELVVSGRVTNTGPQPAFGVRVVLWRSRDPLRDPAAFRSVITGVNQPWGERLNRTSDHLMELTSPSEALDPGRSGDFTLHGTLRDLGFIARGTVYLFGVQVYGTADGSNDFQLLAETRTFVSTAPEKALPLTSVVVLSSAPSRVRPGLFTDDHLAAELDTRLRALLTAAAKPGMSYLVDPSLIDEVADLADGYRVADGEDFREGIGQAVASQWLADFRRLPRAHGARTLFANPDVLGASRSNDRSVLQRTLSASTEVPELSDLPLVALPHERLADARMLAYIAGADAEAVMVTGAGLNPPVVSGPSSSRLVQVSPLDAAGPGTAVGEVQRVQRQYAEAILGGGVVRLLTSAADVDIDMRASAAWLRRTTLDTLLDAEPTVSLIPLVPEQAAMLSSRQFRNIAALNNDLQVYAELSPASSSVSVVAGTLSRAASSSWVGNAEGARFLAAASRGVSRSTLSSRLTLTASPRVVMSSRSNEFPVTITNRLPQTVRVRVHFESENPLRVTVPDSDVVEVPPGQSQTVNIRPEAAANGLVSVNARLVTESGRPVTSNTQISVEATELGMIGWIIVVVSGVVLVATTGWRVKQVRQSQREEQG